MKNIFKLRFIAAFIILILSGSCTKDFIKINTNPNSPTSVPASNVLGQGIISTAGSLFNTKMDLYYAGSYSGMSASLGAGNGDYEFRVDINNSWWSRLYSCMNDFVSADSLASKEGNTILEAVALTMKAYTAQTTTDMFGAIPYSEAFETSKGIIYPKYDSQQDVYKAILSELKTAADIFNNGQGEIGEGDFIFHGDVSKWRKFCNSIRLRAAMRISNVDPETAKSVVTEILGNPANYPVMASNDDNAYLYYPGGSFKDLWNSDSQVGNETWGWYRLNDVLISTLKMFNDPRLPVYALPNIWGIYNGYKFGPAQRSDTMNNSNNLSRIGDRFANDPQGFSPFMNCAEVYFMLAEAYERNLASGDAQEAYENGIKASMEENGVNTSGINQFLAEPGIAWNTGTTSNLDKIYLQEWVSLFKHSLEAWCVARRTDVPLMTNISQDYAGKHNRPPFRFPYPNSEITLNVHFPKDVNSVDIFWGDQLWWDTRKNVH
ncbi:MAG: SusD/RagB family nutrient-binding outer membrane lipoprotein [Chitinophagaceae bacterium]|nr:MAG: SusD/RagB family nutrient-binding outer membrane lipoprotein [Chitinophagaceae bacterium]